MTTPVSTRRRPKVLALILAGGAGGRLGPLTAERAKPTVPFAGTHRLIDFALSNCLHSGLRDVWIIEQSELHSLNDHLANGRPWDLDRTFGGLQILPPSAEKGDTDGDEGGFARGNADALWRQRELLRDFAPDLLLVLSADHVYRCDFRDVLDTHLARDGGADLTLVTVPVPPGDDARRFSLVRVAEGSKGGDDDGSGRVTHFAYKPDRPESNLATAEIFLFDFPRLMATLEELAASGQELKDYGDALLPRLVEGGRVFAHALGGYWRDVGTLPSFWEAHRDLLRPEPPLDVDDPAWPVLSALRPRLPAHVREGARVADSLLSPGVEVRGTVERSVLGPGVRVGAGARVTDAILFDDVHVEDGAVIQAAIVDEHVTIGVGARVGSDDGRRLTIVPRGKKVSAGTHVGPTEDAPEIEV